MSDRPVTILILGGDPDLKAGLLEALSQDAYHLHFSPSLSLARENPIWDRIAVILLDLPTTEGAFESLLPQLRKLSPQAAVIVTTPQPDLDGALTAFRFGISDYLPRPFDPRRLRARLARIAQSRRAEISLAETRARNRAILDVAIDGIITIDHHGIIQTMNPSAVRMFGYSAEEAIGQNVSLLMPAPYRAEHDGYLQRYLNTGEKRIIGIGREVVAQRKDGTCFPVDLSVAEARRGDWRVFVGTIRDITEQKRAKEDLLASKLNLENALAQLQNQNEEIKLMTQQLWQAAKLASVGELAASIAHELNNPLATISLRIESVLARTPADDSRRRALEIIAQESKRMGDLVANLLQFSRRGGDQVSTVDVREELSKAVELVHHLLRKRLIAVEEDYSPETPAIHADRQKLRQLFLNLVTNASDAMPRGGTLTLHTAPGEKDGKPGILLEVRDTGVGIPLENLDRVLEPFFTTKEEGKGTGLGLAICRRVVQEHNGLLEIRSVLNQGTVVRILLPGATDKNVGALRAGKKSPSQTGM